MEKKQPKFWKGDTTRAFSDAFITVFLVGFVNLLFLHWSWHPGIISMIVVFLFVGTNPAFEDKRTEEEKQAELRAIEKRINAEEAQRKATKAKRLDEKIKRNQIRIQKEQLKQMKHSLKCPHCHSTNVKPLGVHRKDFSVGRELFWGHGAGASGRTTNKTDFVCMKCGKRFVK